MRPFVLLEKGRPRPVKRYDPSRIPKAGRGRPASIGTKSLRLASPPAELEYGGMRPVGFYERFVCPSRTRESLERLGGRVPVRPKSYDFGYRFAASGAYIQNGIDPSLRQRKISSRIQPFKIMENFLAKNDPRFFTIRFFPESSWHNTTVSKD